MKKKSAIILHTFLFKTWQLRSGKQWPQFIKGCIKKILEQTLLRTEVKTFSGSHLRVTGRVVQ